MKVYIVSLLHLFGAQPTEKRATSPLPAVGSAPATLPSLPSVPYPVRGRGKDRGGRRPSHPSFANRREGGGSGAKGIGEGGLRSARQGAATLPRQQGSVAEGNYPPVAAPHSNPAHQVVGPYGLLRRTWTWDGKVLFLFSIFILYLNEIE